MKRTFIALAIFLLYVTGIGSASAMDKVKFALDWIPYGKHAMYYVSIDKGFWKEAGLDVQMTRGFGSGDTVKRIASGTDDFGFASVGNMIAAKSRGADLKMVGMVHDKTLETLATLVGNKITKPSDLEGRTIGSPEANAARVIFPAFANINKFDDKKVKWINMTVPATVPSLLAGRVDAILIFYTEKPTLDAAAAKVGKKPLYLLFADHGMATYGNGLMVSGDTLKNKPDLVKRFLAATYKGIAWSVENPQEAVDIFIKHNPAISPDLARKHFDIAVDSLLSENALKEGIGHMTTKRMAFTNDLITKHMKLPKKTAVEDVFTNEYLPKLFPKRGK
jgi:NitT/TauT family transport system substrate-binding protein